MRTFQESPAKFALNTSAASDTSNTIVSSSMIHHQRYPASSATSIWTSDQMNDAPSYYHRRQFNDDNSNWRHCQPTRPTVLGMCRERVARPRSADILSGQTRLHLRPPSGRLTARVSISDSNDDRPPPLPPKSPELLNRIEWRQRRLQQRQIAVPPPPPPVLVSPHYPHAQVILPVRNISTQHHHDIIGRSVVSH